MGGSSASEVARGRGSGIGGRRSVHVGATLATMVFGSEGRVAFALLGLAGFAWSCAKDPGLDRSGEGEGGAGSSRATAQSAGGAAGAAALSRGLVPSVPGDALISELTSTEAIAVCEDVRAALESSAALEQRNACLLDAVVHTKPLMPSGNDDVAACQTAYAACMDSEPSPSTAPDCSQAAEQAPGCKATAHEVNRCLTDLAETREYTEATLSCEESTVGDIAADEGFTVPQSCFELRESCAFLAQ